MELSNNEILVALAKEIVDEMGIEPLEAIRIIENKYTKKNKNSL